MPKKTTPDEFFAFQAQQVCTHCNMRRTHAGHDPCIHGLPGVLFACCGHGTGEGYVMFENGKVLRGQFDGMPLSDYPNKEAPSQWLVDARKAMRE